MYEPAWAKYLCLCPRLGGAICQYGSSRSRLSRSGGVEASFQVTHSREGCEYFVSFLLHADKQRQGPEARDLGQVAELVLGSRIDIRGSKAIHLWISEVQMDVDADVSALAAR
jgi:hypothetical protein